MMSQPHKRPPTGGCFLDSIDGVDKIDRIDIAVLAVPHQRLLVFISGRLFLSAFISGRLFRLSIHQRSKISGTINDPIASDANVLGYRPQ
jgi:hypothetical protein